MQVMEVAGRDVVLIENAEKGARYHSVVDAKLKKNHKVSAEESLVLENLRSAEWPQPV